MEKKNNKYTALLNVMKRELRRLVSRPLYLFCMVIAPLFCYIFFTTLMDSGLPTDMPVGVVDRDMTATSRQLVRNLDAFEQTAVVARYPDISDARIAMQKGEIYGFYYIPEGTIMRFFICTDKIRIVNSVCAKCVGSTHFSNVLFMCYSSLKSAMSLDHRIIFQGSLDSIFFLFRALWNSCIF